MQKEYTIDGKLYRLVEEEKKPYRREYFLYAKGDFLGQWEIRNCKMPAYGHDEVIHVKEIKEGEVIVSSDDVIEAFRKSCYTSLIGYPESLLKELGL